MFVGWAPSPSWVGDDETRLWIPSCAEGVRVVPAAVLHAASSLLEALRAFEPEEFSGRDCGSLAERLAVVEKACAAARARAAARAAKCGAHRELGFADASDWLARATGSSRGEARAELETVEALDEFPEAKNAVLVGELS